MKPAPAPDGLRWVLRGESCWVLWSDESKSALGCVSVATGVYRVSNPVDGILATFPSLLLASKYLVALSVSLAWRTVSEWLRTQTNTLALAWVSRSWVVFELRDSGFQYCMRNGNPLEAQNIIELARKVI